jgi:malonate-semialdehyde dehydrogenase (acetylating)/methylmalonate-semialdehyde dehydrogenase
MAVTVRTLQNFVGGEWVDSTSETAREIVSPVTGESLAEAPDASSEDVDRAVAAAREAQPGWAALSAWERAQVCDTIADLIVERRDRHADQSGGDVRADRAADPEDRRARRRRLD